MELSQDMNDATRTDLQEASTEQSKDRPSNNIVIVTQQRGRIVDGSKVLNRCL